MTEKEWNELPYSSTHTQVMTKEEAKELYPLEDFDKLTMEETLRENLTEEEVLEDQMLQYSMNELTSSGENMLRAMIEAYKEGYNNTNPKNEIDYYLTITNHKIETPKDGKKAVAYLRLERAIRSKVTEISEPTKEGEVQVSEWQTQLVHQEMYVFRSMNERLDPNAPWKERLYLACLYRLAGAGLEYAELLQRMKNTDINTLRDQQEQEDKMKSNIVVTGEMPKPLTPDEEKYKQDIQRMREQTK